MNRLCKKTNKIKLGETPDNPTIRVLHELRVAVRRHCQSHRVRGVAGYGGGQTRFARGDPASLPSAFRRCHASGPIRSKICTLRQFPPVLRVYAVLSSGAASCICSLPACRRD